MGRAPESASVSAPAVADGLGTDVGDSGASVKSLAEGDALRVADEFGASLGSAVMLANALGDVLTEALGEAPAADVAATESLGDALGAAAGEVLGAAETSGKSLDVGLLAVDAVLLVDSVAGALDQDAVVCGEVAVVVGELAVAEGFTPLPLGEGLALEAADGVESGVTPANAGKLGATSVPTARTESPAEKSDILFTFVPFLVWLTEG